MAKRQKNWQHNGQKTEEQTTQWSKDRRTDNTMAKRKKYKRTNNDLQDITQETKDRAIRTPLKTRGELMCSGRVSSFCSTNGTRRVYLVTNPVIGHEWGEDRLLEAGFWSYFASHAFPSNSMNKWNQLCINRGRCDVQRHFPKHFSYIVAVSCIGGRNSSTRRKL
jgi:hypothetical protein